MLNVPTAIKSFQILDIGDLMLTLQRYSCAITLMLAYLNMKISVLQATVEIYVNHVWNIMALGIKEREQIPVVNVLILIQMYGDWLELVLLS